MLGKLGRAPLRVPYRKGYCDTVKVITTQSEQ